MKNHEGMHANFTDVHDDKLDSGILISYRRESSHVRRYDYR